MGAVEDHKAPTSVLERVVSLLDCFTADDSDLTLAALALRTGIPKPTVHRLVGVLVERRLLTRTPTGFTLGIHLFELGELVGDRRALRDASLPYLQELFEQTRETIHLGVLDGDEVLYFAKIVGYKAFPLPTRTGGRWPVHASALGKVLLAFGPPDRYQDLLASDMKALTPYTITDPSRLSLQLTRARREGVAYEIQEAVLGNACVAGPIFDSDGHPVAAVSISGPSVRLRPEQRAPLVRRAAAKITSCISGRVPEGWSSRLPAAAQRQGRELPDRGRTILIRGLSGSEPTQIPG